MSINTMLTATSLRASDRFCGSTWVSTHGPRGITGQWPCRVGLVVIDHLDLPVGSIERAS